MPSSPPVYSLSLHAGYACRHSGACCTAGWPIPVEPSRRPLLGADLLVPDAHGACQFHERTTGLCRIHRDHGEAMLPSSCFHFPRRTLLDERGVFVSLSHFCPTAAALLVSASDPVHIVASPPAFPADREYEGLDGRGAWPPLVKADLLFDLPGYNRWERYLIQSLASAGDSARAVLQDVAAAAERLRDWSSDDGSLDDWIAAVTARPQPVEDTAWAWSRYAPFAQLDAYEHLVSLVPDGLTKREVSDAERRAWTEARSPAVPDAILRRYVAAKAFGSWAAYEAFGLRTMVAELVLAHLVLRVEGVRAGVGRGGPLDQAGLVEAVRAADWLLVHLADRSAVIAWLGQVETS